MMDVPENQHAAWENMLFDAEGNPREQEKAMLSDEMREYLFRLSEVQPVTQPEAGWPDAVAALEARLSKMEKGLNVLADPMAYEGIPIFHGTKQPWSIAKEALAGESDV